MTRLSIDTTRRKEVEKQQKPNKIRLLKIGNEHKCLKPLKSRVILGNRKSGRSSAEKSASPVPTVFQMKK
jgi:hypothetical protein